MACPEGKSIFTNSPQPSGYWENQENFTKFLDEIKEKYQDWNSITRKNITSNRGASLLHKYSIYELKCMACPEGKSIFTNPHIHQDIGKSRKYSSISFKNKRKI